MCRTTIIYLLIKQGRLLPLTTLLQQPFKGIFMLEDALLTNEFVNIYNQIAMHVTNMQGCCNALTQVLGLLQKHKMYDVVLDDSEKADMVNALALVCDVYKGLPDRYKNLQK